MDARAVTAALLDGPGEGPAGGLEGGRNGGDWLGPQLPTINPPLWELGHLAWFWEKWLLRGGDPARRPSALLPDTDALYDSMAVAHATRWSLPLPTAAATWAYLDAVLAQVRERLAREELAGPRGDALAYYTQLCVFHQDMHNEAFAIRRQLLGMARPALGVAGWAPVGAARGDLAFGAGAHLLGAAPETGFAFDNEKWAHPVELPAFAIAAQPVTQGEFAAFVAAGGYARRACWSEAGWRWREQAGAAAPRYWRKQGGAWQVRDFDQWELLAPNLPVVHVNAHEAQAYCAWVGRRLPGEAEWEHAWPQLQSRGMVWEWTDSTFAPYPGFAADPYADYSAPWFDGAHRVLRGGSIATAPRNRWRTWRNFYVPARGDMFCGFRTCPR